MASTIYFDNNATTRVDDRVLESMLPYFTLNYGNPSSTVHLKGLEAQRGVDNARLQVAELLNCIPQEILFTPGATEALNMALKGIYETYRSKGNHIIIAATEHMAVIETCRHLERYGANITILPVNNEGLINLQQLEDSITNNTIGVCVMLANNETGVIQPIKAISEITHQKKTILICDATQGLAKVDVNVNELNVDVLCLSSHKIYGPKGCGAIYIRRKDPRVTLASLIDGGGQERGIRSGTLNVPGIVGLGTACKLINEQITESYNIKTLRDEFEKQLLITGKVKVNGSLEYRAGNVSNLQIIGANAKTLFQKLPDVYFSTGSACSTGKPNYSHVLSSMGLSEEEIERSVRFSFGRFNTMEEINSVAKRLAAIIN